MKFAVWSRYAASFGPALDLWENTAWAALGRHLFRKAIAASWKGDKLELIQLLIQLPQALHLREVQYLLVDAISRRGAPLLLQLAKAVAREHARANDRQVVDRILLGLGRAGPRFKELRRAAEQGVAPAYVQLLSAHAGIKVVTGQDPGGGGEAQRLKESVEQSDRRLSLAYRPTLAAYECKIHNGKADGLFPCLKPEKRDASSLEVPQELAAKRGRRGTLPGRWHIKGVDVF